MIKITKIISLNRLKTGETAIIHSLKGGHGFKSRLSVLGFTPGTEVRMIQNFGYGPIIIEIKDTNIALGRGEAMKIIIEKDNNDAEVEKNKKIRGEWKWKRKWRNQKNIRSRRIKRR